MKIRRAKPEDIVVGKELILVGDNEILHVMKVEEVLNPSDEFKAYCAQDGCRYGLGSSWVIESD